MTDSAKNLNTHHDIALRIALAARALPGTDPQRLLAVLDDCIGFPLTQERLDGLKPSILKMAANGEFSEFPGESLRQAIAFLKGEEDLDQSPLPEIMPYKEGDMPSSLKIACASNSGDKIDGHFGSCARFLIYQLSSTEMRLVDIRNAADADQAPGLVADRPIRRADMLEDCSIVLVSSIEGPAAARVIRLGVHPVRLVSPKRAEEKLSEIQSVMACSPPRWMQKKKEACVG
ncbi:MAG: dinitrogenase iron-molybdenum cofactor biosynthesis protein [Gammaproteobacteria bacterium]|nr:MAG: dinitrogenase iron-molybdenum cofactor biosynthesis protein [Gammaproteobacteria bacterium]